MFTFISYHLGGIWFFTQVTYSLMIRTLKIFLSVSFPYAVLPWYLQRLGSRTRNGYSNPRILMPLYKMVCYLHITYAYSPPYILSFFFFFWWGWNFELRALCLQSSHSYPWATPSVHFALVILEDGVSWTICPYWPLTMILQISASQVARITGMSHWYQALPYILNNLSTAYINTT
jgi:hypothetical protein